MRYILVKHLNILARYTLAHCTSMYTHRTPIVHPIVHPSYTPSSTIVHHPSVVEEAGLGLAGVGKAVGLAEVSVLSYVRFFSLVVGMNIIHISSSTVIWSFEAIDESTSAILILTLLSLSS